MIERGDNLQQLHSTLCSPKRKKYDIQMKNMVHLRVELAEDVGPENRIILLGLAYRVKVRKKGTRHKRKKR
jgi:hypothetical protein